MRVSRLIRRSKSWAGVVEGGGSPCSVAKSGSHSPLPVGQHPSPKQKVAHGPLKLGRRGFGVTERPNIEKAMGSAPDVDVGPGHYDTHEIGCMVWDKDVHINSACQKHLTNHKTPPRASFGFAKSEGSRRPALSGPPAPGHYHLPDLWDPSWQKCPRLGTSFVRQLPAPGESRFGGLARGLSKAGAKSEDFLGS